MDFYLSMAYAYGYKRVCNGFDNMSRLPNELLLSIISFLPMKDAARTSVLSKRWRNLYVLSPNLEFDFSESGAYGTMVLMNAVDRLFLIRNRHPINRFGLCCSESQGFQPSHLEWWIHCMMWHGIREIDLFVPADLMIPPSLFSCKTLVVLHLSSKCGAEMEIPAEVFLPSLKDLYLNDVISFAKDAAACERLISNCPVLESFVYAIENDDGKFVVSSPTLKHLNISCILLEIVIDAPSLVSLEYCVSHAVSHKFINVPSLTRAKLHFLQDEEADGDYTLAVTDLIRAVSKVSELDISGGTLEDLLKYKIPVPAMQNLTLLNLSYDLNLGFEEILHFLSCCENLKSLYIEELPHEFNLDAREDLEETRACCLLFSLKKIDITSFRDHGDQMEMIKYFLKSARVLESLKLHIRSNDARYDEQLKMSKKLMMFPRGSKMCRIKLRELNSRRN